MEIVLNFALNVLQRGLLGILEINIVYTCTFGIFVALILQLKEKYRSIQSGTCFEFCLKCSFFMIFLEQCILNRLFFASLISFRFY